VLERSGFAITVLVFISFDITERKLLNKIKYLILHLHCNVSNMKIRLMLGCNSV
jgi:hypothetical protein